MTLPRPPGLSPVASVVARDDRVSGRPTPMIRVARGLVFAIDTPTCIPPNIYQGSHRRFTVCVEFPGVGQ